MIKYYSVNELVTKANTLGKNISDLVIAQQAKEIETSEEELYNKMLESFNVMKESVQEGLDPHLKSASGMSGGSAYKMKSYIEKGNSLCGKTFGTALARALAVAELNSCMGKIVAAPTAGACGILPGTLITMLEEHNVDEQKVVMSLFTASALGMVIAHIASISGAEGGCQAECGSASAMAAGALVEIAGGTPDMVAHACAIAIKNSLGLVCDPVAGLVEVPCNKRNAGSVANAFAAAEMALAGIESVIPCDEVILAMKKVGDLMSYTLKETAEGGLAATPTAKKISQSIYGNQ